MKYDRTKVVDIAKSLIGLKESDGSHKKIIDIYNTIKPLPRGYKVTYKDSWCAATASVIFHIAGYDDIFPTECSCVQVVEKAKKMGIWQEKDSYVPKPGDAILYDWQDNGKGNNKGTPDHIGIVEKVTSEKMTIIEGNYDDQVKRRTFKINNKCIRGFVTPKFDKETAKKETKTTEASKDELNKTPICEGKVTALRLNVRTWAGTGYSKCSFGPLSRGEIVRICATINAKNGKPWYYIKYGARYGFVSAKWVKKL